MMLVTERPAYLRRPVGFATYDPVKDIAPVTLIGTYPRHHAVGDNSPFKSVSDYIA